MRRSPAEESVPWHQINVHNPAAPGKTLLLRTLANSISHGSDYEMWRPLAEHQTASRTALTAERIHLASLTIRISLARARARRPIDKNRKKNVTEAYMLPAIGKLKSAFTERRRSPTCHPRSAWHCSVRATLDPVEQAGKSGTSRLWNVLGPSG